MIIVLKNKELRFTTKILSALRLATLTVGSLRILAEKRTLRKNINVFLLQLFLYKTFMFYI